MTRKQAADPDSWTYNGVWLDPNARLTQWDEALATIASRLQEIIEQTGPESIYHTHYTGTCSLIASSFPSRFFDHLGATEVDPDTICNNAAQPVGQCAPCRPPLAEESRRGTRLHRHRASGGKLP